MEETPWCKTVLLVSHRYGDCDACFTSVLKIWISVLDWINTLQPCLKLKLFLRGFDIIHATISHLLNVRSNQALGKLNKNNLRGKKDKVNITTFIRNQLQISSVLLRHLFQTGVHSSPPAASFFSYFKS